MSTNSRNAIPPSIEVVENKNGRTVTFPALNKHGSFSLRPILRERSTAKKNDWPLSELDLTVTSSPSTAWHMQATVFAMLTIEDTELLIAILAEARDIIKKHEEECHE